MDAHVHNSKLHVFLLSTSVDKGDTKDNPARQPTFPVRVFFPIPKAVCGMDVRAFARVVTRSSPCFRWAGPPRVLQTDRHP